MHALESRQHTQRSLEGLRLREVDLDDFISRRCAGVLHVAFHRDGITGFDRERRNLQAAVRKTRVAEAEAEAIERFVREITIGPPAHGILLKWRDLAERRIE